MFKSLEGKQSNVSYVILQNAPWFNNRKGRVTYDQGYYHIRQLKPAEFVNAIWFNEDQMNLDGDKEKYIHYS